MKKTLTVTLPDGSKAKRTTEHPYKFVFANRWLNYGDGKWYAQQWSRTEANAQKTASRFLAAGKCEVQVIPVDGGQS